MKTSRPHGYGTRVIALATVWGVFFFFFFFFCLARAAAALPDGELSTPRRAMSTFLDSANRQDWGRAAAVLNLAHQPTRGGEVARQLNFLLSRNFGVELDNISDEAEGKPEDGKNTDIVATLQLGRQNVPIVMTRLLGANERWVFSSSTVALIPELYRAHGPTALEEKMPASLRREMFGLAHWQWIGLVTALVLALVLARLIVFVLYAVASRIVPRTRFEWDDELIRELRAPGRLLMTIVVFLPLAHLLALPANYRLVLLRIVGTLGICAMAWIAIRIVGLISNAVERRAIGAGAAGTAGLRVRGVQTQVRVLRRVVSVALAVCAAAFVLMQFDTVRSIGVSLLASAGIAGVVLGLAAQRTLGSLFAGIQLSITQPIRIGDAVIVEGEFGTIEEITLTYIVVRVWDERRLIVPMTRFFDQPFQNWTKVSTQLHGTVMLYADYGLPVDALRAELQRLVREEPDWDGRTSVVHVTDARERTLEIRVLVSAEDAGKLFGLRASLREKLAAWIFQLEGGRYLPRTRVDDNDRLKGAAEDPGPAQGQ